MKSVLNLRNILICQNCLSRCYTKYKVNCYYTCMSFFIVPISALFKVLYCECLIKLVRAENFKTIYFDSMAWKALEDHSMSSGHRFGYSPCSFNFDAIADENSSKTVLCKLLVSIWVTRGTSEKFTISLSQDTITAQKLYFLKMLSSTTFCVEKYCSIIVSTFKEGHLQGRSL